MRPYTIKLLVGEGSQCVLVVVLCPLTPVLRSRRLALSALEARPCFE